MIMAGRLVTRVGFLGSLALVAGALFTACSSSSDGNSQSSGGSGGSAGSAVAGSGTAGSNSNAGSGTSGGSNANGGSSANGGTTSAAGASEAGASEAGSDAVGEAGAPVTTGPMACNDVVQQGSVVTPVNSAAAIPAQTRGPIGAGTYVLTSETWYNTANLNQARNTPTSTVRVSVQNSTVTLEFLGLLNVDGAFTLTAVLPDDETQPPTSVTVTCSAVPELLPTGSNVPVDYTASATTLKLVDNVLSTVDVYTKL
jgi:hypothetical protein